MIWGMKRMFQYFQPCDNDPRLKGKRPILIKMASPVCASLLTVDYKPEKCWPHGKISIDFALHFPKFALRMQSIPVTLAMFHLAVYCARNDHLCLRPRISTWAPMPPPRCNPASAITEPPVRNPFVVIVCTPDPEAHLQGLLARGGLRGPRHDAAGLPREVPVP